MASVELTDTHLVARLSWAEGLLALKRRVAVPWAHVRDARRADLAPEALAGWKVVGTQLPGGTRYGTFRRHGRTAFMALRHPDRAVVVELAGERYAYLVLEVANPDAVAAEIRTRAQRRGAG
jgi:hypothetical protein